jgi:hypothetical protein
MIENDLERLLRTAQDEPGLQPVLFRALLDATVYALMPLSDQGPADGRVRFLQWARPDGVTVIPCFASELKARLSAQSKARVAAIDGRQLMEVTRGATLHLDPNDFSCTLSPTDISSLLMYGAVQVPEHEVISEPRPMQFTAPKSPPATMLSSLSVLYDTLGFVARGFLLEMRAPEAPDVVRTLLVALELDGRRDAHRAARDSTTVIQETYHGPLPIDLIVLDDVSEMAQLIRSEFPPFYSRRALKMELSGRLHRN